MKRRYLTRSLPAHFLLLILISAPTFAAPISGQGTWETTLIARDLDGIAHTSEAYYDTVLDITWLKDANYAKTSGVDNDGTIGDGLMQWSNMTSWIASLDFNGITGWRLPTTNPVDGTTADDADYSYIGTEDRGFNVSAPGTLFAGSTASEMAYMFYNTLGNLADCDPITSTVSSCSAQSGSGLSNTGPFAFLQSYGYWSATGDVHYTGWKWVMNMNRGYQTSTPDTNGLYGWAVHDGDVGAAVVAPIPAGAWLFGSGLVGLASMIRRKKSYC